MFNIRYKILEDEDIEPYELKGEYGYFEFQTNDEIYGIYIDEILDTEPMFTLEYLKMLEWVANYYFSDLPTVLKTALPEKFFQKNLKNYRKPNKELKVLQTEKSKDKHTLSKEQQKIYDDIKKVDAKTSLLYGITGSGKTEIYFKLIEDTIKEGKNVVAMMAPAIAGQFPYPVEKVRTALLKIGFKDVLEVAQGADVTTLTEAEDFKERMAENAPFMTTSCCAAYNELVKKHIPEIKPYVSETGTPMYYTAEIAKKKDPNCVTVFISPCSAKRREALDNPNADYVINFDELGSILVAMKIEVNNLEDTEFEVKSSKEGRNFPLSGGVAEAVKSALELKGEDVEIHPCLINGLNKQAIKELKGYAKTGTCPNGNLIEVMACMGGCIGGNSALNAQRKAQKQVTDYANEGEPVVKKEDTIEQK